VKILDKKRGQVHFAKSWTPILQNANTHYRTNPDSAENSGLFIWKKRGQVHLI